MARRRRRKSLHLTSRLRVTPAEQHEGVADGDGRHGLPLLALLQALVAPGDYRSGTVSGALKLRLYAEPIADATVLLFRSETTGHGDSTTRTASAADRPIMSERLAGIDDAARLLERTQEAVIRRDPIQMLEALTASRYLDGLTRRLQKQWGRLSSGGRGGLVYRAGRRCCLRRGLPRSAHPQPRCTSSNQSGPLRFCRKRHFPPLCRVVWRPRILSSARMIILA